MSTMTPEKQETPITIANEPTNSQAPNNDTPPTTPPAGEHSWREEIELAGSQLVERVKELIAEGNVRSLSIRNAEDKVMLEIPLTAGVAVGGVITLVSPVLAALGALAALLAHVKVEIVREDAK